MPNTPLYYSMPLEGYIALELLTIAVCLLPIELELNTLLSVFCAFKEHISSLQYVVATDFWVSSQTFSTTKWAALLAKIQT